MSNRQEFDREPYRKEKRPADRYGDFEVEFPEDELEEEEAEERPLTEEEIFELRRKKRRAAREARERARKQKQRLFIAACTAALALILIIVIVVARSTDSEDRKPADQQNQTTEAVKQESQPSGKEDAEKTGSEEDTVSPESQSPAAEETPVTDAAEQQPSETADPASLVTDAARETTNPLDSTDENGNWIPPYPTDITVPSWITQDYIDIHEKTRPGRLLTSVDNIVVHYVGNPGTSAKANRDYFNDIPLHDDERGASAHFVVGFDGEIIQCVPLGEMAQANYPRNDYTISIETCHPDETGKFTETTYRTLIKLVSWLCEEYGLTADQVIRHYDVSGKYCPMYYCPNTLDNPNGHPEEWEQFKAEIRYYMDKYPDISATDP